MINLELARHLKRTPGEVWVPAHACGTDHHVRAHKGDLLNLLMDHPDDEWWQVAAYFEADRSWMNRTLLHEST